MLLGAYPPPGWVGRVQAGYPRGMSLFSKAAKFARSPQGKKAMDKAKDFASKPETKEKIEQAREKLSGKDKQPAGGQTAGNPAGAVPDTEPAKPAADPATPAEGGTPPVNAGAGQPAGEQPAQGNPPQSP